MFFYSRYEPLFCFWWIITFIKCYKIPKYYVQNCRRFWKRVVKLQAIVVNHSEVITKSLIRSLKDIWGLLGKNIQRMTKNVTVFEVDNDENSQYRCACMF